MNRVVLPSIILAAFLTVGCGTAKPQEAEYPEEVKQNPADQLAQYRASLELLQRNAFAAEASGDLGKAESWIGQAEPLMADGSKEEVELLLQAIGGQLALVQSFFGRREAESALERVRADYQKRRKSEAALTRQVEEISKTELEE